MGVDVSVFAKKSKVRLLADRAWVVNAWNSQDPLMNLLRNKIYNSEEGLDLGETLYYLYGCLKEHIDPEHADEDSAEYAKYWIGEMVKFVKTLPNDTFFLLNDHMDEYHDIREEYETFDPLSTK